MLGLKMSSYNIVVKNKNKYVFFIKELSLIHTSTSLAKGYKDIENKSNEIINNLKINNLESHIPEPSTNIGFIDKNKNIFC